MSIIEKIKQKIDSLGYGEFQTLCDAYLSKSGYPELVSLGTKSGTKKTTKGTPDTYIPLENGKYIFVEYTTRKTSLSAKIKDDLSKCFDEEKTGIKCSDISKVLYFHTSSNITAKQDNEIRTLANQHNVQIEITGIDKLANILFNNYECIIKQYLDISISTDQILTKYEFVTKYDNSPTSAPLNTDYMFRQDEIDVIKNNLSQANAVLISGDAGIGKTRLALEASEQYAKENDLQFWVIRNNNERIWDDLNLYFDKNGKYIILIDDANEIGNLKTYLEFLRDRSNAIKIVITARKYALNDVSAKLDSVMKSKQINIEKLKEEEIEKMIGHHFHLNSIALEKISSLSNGNPRIAFLAGRLAEQTNELSSLNNISELYKNYYGAFLKEKEINDSLFICAGIIAFVKRINLDTLTNMEDILDICNLKTDGFLTGVHKLHDMEIVDLYKNKGVKYSDQCLSDFILYYVFIEKRLIDLSDFTEHFFQKNEEQTVQSINTLMNNFYDENNFRFIRSKIKTVWDSFKDNNSYRFDKFFMRFYALFSIDTILIIKEKIEQAVPKAIAVEELKTTPNYNRYTEDWLDVLASYNYNLNHEYFKNAVDLFLMYYLKCPADYDNIIYCGRLLSGIRKVHLQHENFDNQIAFVNKLVEKSENWTNKYITVLFLDLAGNLLELYFEQIDRKHDNSVFIHGDIPWSEEIIELRKSIWLELIKLTDDALNVGKIIDIINDYGRTIQESNLKILKFDLQYISTILDRLVNYNRIDTIIAAEHIRMICNALQIEITALDIFLNIDKYQLYHLLNENYIEIEDLDQMEKQTERDIKEFLDNKPETALIDIINIGYELNQIGKLEYKIEDRIRLAFNSVYEKKEVFLEAIKYYLKKWEFNDILYPPAIVSKLFDLFDDESVKGIIALANERIHNNWWFAYYYELPKELINEKTCDELLSFLQEKTDSIITTSPNRRLDFLQKYEKYDGDIFLKACKIILSKNEYSHFIPKIYFDLLFNSHYLEPIDLVSKFSNNLSLLASMYMEMIAYNGFDRSGEYMATITQAYPQILNEYLLFYRDNKQIRYSDMLVRLSALFSLDNYLEIFDTIMKALLEIPFISMTISSLLDIRYNPKDTIITERIVSWMKHYITLYYLDYKKMDLLFIMNAYIEQKSRIEVIKFFLSINSDFDTFKKLNLFPVSYSWSGSKLPLIQHRIDFLTDLKSQLTDISFVEHKAYINERIESLEEHKERVEVDEMIGNR